MEKEIINRVAGSNLEIFDLEDYYPNIKKTEIDISQWLNDGFILKEKDYREALKNFNFSQYQDHYIAIYCSTDAILPAWAMILLTIYLSPFAKKIINGRIEDLDVDYYREILPDLDYTVFQDKAVIIKGCSKKPVPDRAYILAAQYLQPYAKSIMYGEACSAVPLFKKITKK